MNKLIPIFTSHELIWDEENKDTTEPLWFSLQFWCMQSKEFHYIDLTPILPKERHLTDGRFKFFQKKWSADPVEEIPIEITVENINDLLSWADQNIKNSWSISVDKTRMYYDGKVINSFFQFDNEADAAFFKLTWA